MSTRDPQLVAAAVAVVAAAAVAVVVVVRVTIGSRRGRRGADPVQIEAGRGALLAWEPAVSRRKTQSAIARWEHDDASASLEMVRDSVRADGREPTSFVVVFDGANATYIFHRLLTTPTAAASHDRTRCLYLAT